MNVNAAGDGDGGYRATLMSALGPRSADRAGGSFRREIGGCFRKARTSALGRDLPKGDSPEAAVLWRGSFRALKSRQLSGERDVRSGSRTADRRLSGSGHWMVCVTYADSVTLTEG